MVVILKNTKISLAIAMLTIIVAAIFISGCTVDDPDSNLPTPSPTPTVDQPLGSVIDTIKNNPWYKPDYGTIQVKTIDIEGWYGHSNWAGDRYFYTYDITFKSNNIDHYAVATAKTSQWDSNEGISVWIDGQLDAVNGIDYR